MWEFFTDVGMNLLVAAIGAIALWIFQVSVKAYKNWRLQKQFPLAGEYITFFEDEEDGKPYVASAPISLRQEGRKISGITMMDDREWKLEGELSEDGYLHGIYSATNPLDRGVGNFFLRVESTRTMDGMWSGFDSVNGKLASGGYTFRPVINDVIIRPARQEDVVRVLHIADQQLGDGYVETEQIHHYLDDDNCFLLVAEHHNIVVGFSACAILSREEAQDMMRIPLPRYMKILDQIGVVKTVAVDLRHAKHGVGTRLVRESLDKMISLNVPAVFSVAWKRLDTVNIKGVLTQLGFEELEEVKEYWREESFEEGFECPQCKEPPCECSAVMFARPLTPV